MGSASEKFRDNLRKAARRKLHYPATIEAGQRPCMIWDISNSGAKLTIGDDEDVPEEFNLLLSQDGMARRRCRLVWRQGLHAGVKFLPDISS